jgi:hypothetical protein
MKSTSQSRRSRTSCPKRGYVRFCGVIFLRLTAVALFDGMDTSLQLVFSHQDAIQVEKGASGKRRPW